MRSVLFQLCYTEKSGSAIELRAYESNKKSCDYNII